ncbi:DUF177 domain-containing protein, partial [Candidatus Saccharibacteria bacterium]|nr:DUF177 domain-containing protein [Candidatus Saccharibacteria bacterium]NIW78323.1 hypothetical protein [Calditrichia bacterium]
KALYTCDRCLSEYYEPIQIQFQLLFHLGKKLESDEDDVINLKKETVEVDLNTWIIEQLILA